MLGSADFTASRTLVQAAVVRMNGRYIQVRHHIAVNGDILADLEAFIVRDFFVVEFPGDFRRWIASGYTFQKDGRSWTKCLLGECLPNDRWIDCVRTIRQTFSWVIELNKKKKRTSTE